jgi:hypothetical protein
MKQEVYDRIKKLRANGATVVDACKAAGVETWTWYDANKKRPKKAPNLVTLQLPEGKSILTIIHGPACDVIAALDNLKKIYS